MSISAKIICDSINGVTNDRLTTFIVTFPRFLLPEFNTHRMISKNGASSRAIPLKKQIQRVQANPFIPEYFGKNQSGMQADESLDKEKEFEARAVWKESIRNALEMAGAMEYIGLHKQLASRILEPFSYQTMLCSGTEWGNFFALRAHKDAQPEFRILAEKMLEEYNKSIPEIKYPCSIYGEDYSNWETGIDYEKEDWHAPFSDKMYEGISKLDSLKISIARAARISYNSFDGETDIQKDFAIYDKLLTSAPLHASPAEHVAFPISESKFVGNFRGFCQFRKLLPNENQRDGRIIKRTVVQGVVI